MTRTIQTTYRYRLDPTPAQDHRLDQFAGARRFVWNWALNRTREHFQQTDKMLSYNDLAAALTRLKQQPDTAWLREMESQSLQQALRDLDSAYQHFFRRVKKGQKNKGFPRFKSRKTDTPRFRIPQRVTLQGSFLSVLKIGLVGVVLHRPLDGVTKGATFKQEACGHWYVSIVTEQQVDPRTNPPVRTHIGIDVGLMSLAAFSTGETIDNPRWYRTQSRKLRRAQKALSLTVKGSSNRNKARVVVARLHQKVKNQRSDFLHKLSTDLVRHFDLVSIEDLNVRGLAKTKLSKSVFDAGWGMFRSMLKDKAERNDSSLITIGRFYPSTKLCSACGAQRDALTLSDREWICVCGVHHDRDLNAARNIDREGVRLFEQMVAAGYAATQNACGDLVNPIERLALVDETGSPNLKTWVYHIPLIRLRKRAFSKRYDTGAVMPGKGRQVRSQTMRVTGDYSIELTFTGTDEEIAVWEAGLQQASVEPHIVVAAIQEQLIRIARTAVETRGRGILKLSLQGDRFHPSYVTEAELIEQDCPALVLARVQTYNTNTHAIILVFRAGYDPQRAFMVIPGKI